jgi:hypothetical protein
MTDTRTLYVYYRRRRAVINLAKDAAALLFALAAIYAAWAVWE